MEPRDCWIKCLNQSQRPTGFQCFPWSFTQSSQTGDFPLRQWVGKYDAKAFVQMLTELNVKISRSKPGCPWENGYQESFYDKFKIDLGDPDRFDSLGELIYNIYHQIYFYNHQRIHPALKRSPIQFSILAQNAKNRYRISV